MTHIPPTPRRDRSQSHDPWGEDDPPGRRDSSGKRWIVFIVVAVGLTGLVIALINRYPGALDSEYAMVDLVRWGAILVLVASGILASRRLNVGKAVRDIAIWSAVVAGLVAVYGFRSELQTAGYRIVGELEPARGRELAGGEMEFRRSGDGHFYIDATVNGHTVRFLVDTGATEIVLSPQDAGRAGYQRNALTFNRRYETANGWGWGAAVTLRSLEVGTVRFHDVEASVNDAPMTDSLLGMAFLDRFAGFEVRGDSLILRP